MEHKLIIDAICIVAAWILALGAQRLKQPVILACLLASVAVGPTVSGNSK